MRILFMAVFLAAGALWGATASNAAPFKPVALQGIETSVATEVHYRRHLVSPHRVLHFEC